VTDDELQHAIRVVCFDTLSEAHDRGDGLEWGGLDPLEVEVLVGLLSERLLAILATSREP
jgi:hypothetical protein